MKISVYQYSLPIEGMLEDLNAFLAQNKVVSVKHYLTSVEDRPMLVFVVETITGISARKGESSGPKVDYREVLSSEEFGLFSQLRDLRKTLADSEGVPAYTLFTNAQLAEMVKLEVKDETGLSKMSGVGKAKMDKYAAHFLKLLNADYQEGNRTTS